MKRNEWKECLSVCDWMNVKGDKNLNRDNTRCKALAYEAKKKRSLMVMVIIPQIVSELLFSHQPDLRVCV